MGYLTLRTHNTSVPKIRAQLRQTVFGEFQAKCLASSSNDIQELFRKWHIQYKEKGKGQKEKGERGGGTEGGRALPQL